VGVSPGANGATGSEAVGVASGMEVAAAGSSVLSGVGLIGRDEVADFGCHFLRSGDGEV